MPSGAGALRTSTPNRITSVSGIKAVALILVFVWHAGVLKAPDLGARMCELFFVCSGVLEALNHHGKYSYSLDETVSIVKSKLAKVYPLYAAVLNLLMMQTWFSNLQFSFNGVSWFVADLMLCYLITPLLSWWIRQRETSADASVLRSYLVPFAVLFCIRVLLQMGQYKGVINISNHSFPLSRMLEYGMAFVAGTAILARGGGYQWGATNAETLCGRFLHGGGIGLPLYRCTVCLE